MNTHLIRAMTLSETEIYSQSSCNACRRYQFGNREYLHLFHFLPQKYILRTLRFLSDTEPDYLTPWNVLLLGASFKGDIEAIKFCENKGADWWGDALVYAAEGGHLHILQYCEQKYAEREGEPAGLNKALGCAAFVGNLHIVKYCEQNGADDWIWALKNAAFGGNLDIVKYCEQKDPKDWNGTKLNWNWIIVDAASGGHLDIVQYCEQKGAELNVLI